MESLASEMLSELKANNKRLFIALVVVLVLWFATIGAFLWYVSLPIEEVSVEQCNEGDANTMIGIGDLNGKPSESYLQTESNEKS